MTKTGLIREKGMVVYSLLPWKYSGKLKRERLRQHEQWPGTEPTSQSLRVGGP